MRVVCIALLLIGVGCRTGRETASVPDEGNLASPTVSLASTTDIAAAHSGVVPVAFSAESVREVHGDRNDPLLPDQWQPSIQDDSAALIESVFPSPKRND